ncbi:Na(+)/H(+) antiporter subunit B [Woodsholea maritima]|uniref:Na(+)/H(+) antiporter subunit B n=1 Tax=Woodsholea maritima TaxID=240237 RepID=UPI000369A63A|nr:Na(+)/H(+) antiporter subunit B [Woodsholea maritima]
MMPPHIVLRVVSKLLIPFIVVFGFYVHFHGDYSPGGGFQAGVILAAAVILYALIFGVDAAKKAVPPSWVRIGMALGGLIYAGTGIVTLLMGGDFLDYDVLHPDLSHKSGQHIGIMCVELGVLTTVTCVMLAIFYAFAGRTPDISDEDW